MKKRRETEERKMADLEERGSGRNNGGEREKHDQKVVKTWSNQP